MAVPIAFPALAFIGLNRLGMTPRNKVAMAALQMGLISLQLLVSLPASMACFPQIQKIQASALEEEFQCMRSEVTGELITEFSYNKGL